ncbi:hypothetical protein HYPSUDRAFT_126273 [Hypholoma sublateritium FD-334 SS-4]|uniref:Gem-associated protein 2 n=1 Tax=Hypholoma sublateritium (strain FD-334 SS-4) TaxID=945553 RepID=A0A0D2LP65_HYPSF|nr:hypothetical protein HYPSUDRAFT_126273 [Hypholoma sublateritium FD-334 SS-4]
MSYKRKWEETEDSDDEPAYGKQILPVANLPEDFNEEPVDGLQYLFMVRRDARQLPSTVRAPNPYEKPEPEIVENVGGKSFDDIQLPSEEWRQLFELRFKNFRKNFAQCTTHIGPTIPPRKNLIPDKKDRESWWSFLSGRPESEWNLSKKVKLKARKQPAGMRGWADSQRVSTTVQNSWNNDEGEVEEELMIDPAETLPSPKGTPVPLDCLEAMSQPGSSTPITSYPMLEEEKFVPREPITQFLKLIDERSALHLLMYFTHWINHYLSSPGSEAYLPTDSHARWVFCLLSRIDDFISPDDMNLLRNLARACIALLKYIKKQETSLDSSLMSEPSCWILVSTVAEIWKQKDLWLDAEHALRICKA